MKCAQLEHDGKSFVAQDTVTVTVTDMLYAQWKSMCRYHFCFFYLCCLEQVILALTILPGLS